MTATRNGGRDDTPVRRSTATPSPTFTAYNSTRTSPELIAFIADCDRRRKEAAWRLPRVRDLSGLAGHDPMAAEWINQPRTYGMGNDEIIAEAERMSAQGWSDEEIQLRLAVKLR